MAQVAAVWRVQSLAWEIPHAEGMTKKKRKKKNGSSNVLGLHQGILNSTADGQEVKPWRLSALPALECPDLLLAAHGALSLPLLVANLDALC